MSLFDPASWPEFLRGLIAGASAVGCLWVLYLERRRPVRVAVRVVEPTVHLRLVPAPPVDWERERWA